MFGSGYFGGGYFGAYWGVKTAVRNFVQVGALSVVQLIGVGTFTQQPD